MKKLAFVILFISLCFSSCVGNDASSDIIECEGEMSMIDDNVDRVLKEDDFSFLKKGMSLEEIITVVGEADGISGFNILTPFYILEDGRLGLVFEPLFSSSFEYLLYYTISCPDGEQRKVDLE